MNDNIYVVVVINDLVKGLIYQRAFTDYSKALKYANGEFGLRWYDTGVRIIEQ